MLIPRHLLQSSMLFNKSRGQQTFSCEGQRASILGFAGHVVLVTTISLVLSPDGGRKQDANRRTRQCSHKILQKLFTRCDLACGANLAELLD